MVISIGQEEISMSERQILTTASGVPVGDNPNSLSA